MTSHHMYLVFISLASKTMRDLCLPTVRESSLEWALLMDVSGAFGTRTGLLDPLYPFGLVTAHR